LIAKHRSAAAQAMNTYLAGLDGERAAPRVVA
jgi:hypothetical protein